jgi:hypothetical protein
MHTDQSLRKDARGGQLALLFMDRRLVLMALDLSSHVL